MQEMQGRRNALTSHPREKKMLLGGMKRHRNAVDVFAPSSFFVQIFAYRVGSLRTIYTYAHTKRKKKKYCKIVLKFSAQQPSSGSFFFTRSEVVCTTHRLLRPSLDIHSRIIYPTFDRKSFDKKCKYSRIQNASDMAPQTDDSCSSKPRIDGL